MLFRIVEKNNYCSDNMMVIVFVLCFIYFIPTYGFRSQFIIGENIHEEQFLKEIHATPDIQSVLIASGINPKYYSSYASKIILWKSEIEKLISAGSSQKDIATQIGYYLHEHVFSKYKLEATTLKEVFETKEFNCLSATILVNILLRSFGINAQSIILPTHVYTMAVLDGQPREIENTIPYGVAISQDKNIQNKFNQLTGFDYTDNMKQKIVIGWPETLGLLYSNRSYFNAKNNEHHPAFQNMLKAQIFLSETPSEHKNLIAGYLNYSYYIYKNKSTPLKKYLKTLSILEEGMSLFPNSSNLQRNYLKGLDIVIDKMIGCRAKSKDIDYLLASSKKYILPCDFKKLEKSRYIRSIKNHIELTSNYKEAIDDINKFWKLYPEEPYALDFIKKYSWAVVKKEIGSKAIKENAVLLFILSGFPSHLTEEALGYYYSELARHNFDCQNYDYAVAIMKEGGARIGKNSLIAKNGFAYAVNSAKYYIQQKDPDKALLFYQQALFFKNDKNIINNMAILYSNLIEKYIAQKQLYKAHKLLEEGLATIPNNYQLIHLKKKLI